MPANFPSKTPQKKMLVIPGFVYAIGVAAVILIITHNPMLTVMAFVAGMYGVLIGAIWLWIGFGLSFWIGNCGYLVSTIPGLLYLILYAMDKIYEKN